MEEPSNKEDFVKYELDGIHAYISKSMNVLGSKARIEYSKFLWFESLKLKYV